METPPAGDGLAGAGDALIVGIPVAGAAGLVLEHPATARAITTNIIAVILIGEIFIFSLRVWWNPGNFLLRGKLCRDQRVIL
jgi:hypothetical protein